MFRRTFAAYRSAYSGLPAPVWMLAAVLLVSRCGTMVFPFLTLYLSQERGLSVPAAGQLLAVYGAAGIFGTWIGGWLCPRWGAVRVVLASLTLAIPGYLLMPLCPSVELLALVLLYQGIVCEAGRPACTTATTLFCSPEEHPRALAINRLALNLGMTVGPSIGGLLATISFPLLFVVNAAFAAGAAVVGAAFFRPWRKAASRTDPSPAALSTLRSALPLRNGVFLRYLGLQFFAGTVFFQLLSTMPLTWRDRYGLDEGAIGGLFAINTVVIVLLEMVLLQSVRRFTAVQLIAAGTGLVCVGFGVIAFGHSLYWAVCSVLIWTLGEMLAAPFSASYVARLSDERSRGAYMGYFAMTFSAANVVAPLLGTWLYSRHPDLPWWCCLAVAPVLTAGFLRLDRRASGQEPVATREAPHSGDVRRRPMRDAAGSGV